VIVQLGPRDFSVLAWVRDEGTWERPDQGRVHRRGARAGARAAGQVMDRRAFLGTLGLLAAALAANAQQAGKVPRYRGMLTLNVELPNA